MFPSILAVYINNITVKSRIFWAPRGAILGHFGRFWVILADFGRFWPPELPQGGFCVFWGCPGVFPGVSHHIGRLNQ